MSQEEMQNLCLKKNLLLDASLLEVFSSFKDPSLAGLLLEKIKTVSGRRFITFSTIKENRKKIKEFIDEIFSGGDGEKKEIWNKLDFSINESPVEREEKKSFPAESSVKVLSSNSPPGKKLELKDFVVYFRKRYESVRGFLENNPSLENPVSINKISSERQKISIIGLVFDKRVTKNKNVIFEVEDLTGRMKVLVSAGKEDLLKESEDVVLDSIVGFKGVGNGEILFANEIIFPEANLSERKRSDLEEYALFIGDLHYGSKNFLERDFSKFVDYLNGKFPNTPEVMKIKYLFIIGDLITGIGNYPNQESDLKISSLEAQFEGIAGLLKKIRNDIKIIISPGNHDCVRIMEPQPLLDEKYAWPLYDLPNVIITGNPSSIKIGETKSFEGFKVLAYHGFSFPYYANAVPDLISVKAMNQPEKIMKFLLKHRHLAPTHASTQYFPVEKDALLIREIPDIFVSGHTHKSGVTHFNNILVVSVSSWEGLTSYQEKFGNKPDHCKVPMFNLKTRQIRILDFETGEDNIKLYRDEE